MLFFRKGLFTARLICATRVAGRGWRCVNTARVLGWPGGREAWVGGWDACRFVTWPDQRHFPAQPTATLLVGGAVIVACTWLVCDDDPPSPLRTATGPARSSPRTRWRHQTVSLWASRRRCVCWRQLQRVTRSMTIRGWAPLAFIR